MNDDTLGSDAEIARGQAIRASNGDPVAAASVLSDCIIGLRSVIEQGVIPEADRVESLRFLYEALVEIIELGEEPRDALRLVQPDHRPANDALGVRDVRLFVLVGQHSDALTSRGHTRFDKPINGAIKSVAKSERLSTATVQKAWSKYGSEKGWAKLKPDWKEGAD